VGPQDEDDNEHDGECETTLHEMSSLVLDVDDLVTRERGVRPLYPPSATA